MTREEFDRILDRQLKLVQDVFEKKTDEYATTDQLSNFRKSAGLQSITVPQAVVGMMSKHTVSVFDMAGSRKSFPHETWDEKITDHIIYLILLKAAALEVVEPEKE